MRVPHKKHQVHARHTLMKQFRRPIPANDITVGSRT